ncbi:pentatricopeptide repeat-containing protein [Hordeum vulgare]|nr:pentatricopeptide repeat-containing protein [Hordeum vulgare]
MASLPICPSSPSSFLSWPHRPISLSFQPRNHSPSASLAASHVAVQDSPPPSDPGQNPKISSTARFLWVNPDSPRAAELARAHGGSRRRARLTAAAAALAMCEPAEAPVAAALEATFPEAPSEQDATIMLNTAARNPATTMLALR